MQGPSSTLRTGSKGGSEGSQGLSDNSDRGNDGPNTRSSDGRLDPPSSGDSDHVRHSSTGSPSQRWSSGSQTPSSKLADFHHVIPGMTPEVMVAMTANFIHGKQEERLWTSGDKGEGVLLKKTRGTYITCPETLARDGSHIHEAVRSLNVQVS